MLARQLAETPAVETGVRPSTETVTPGTTTAVDANSEASKRAQAELETQVQTLESRLETEQSEHTAKVQSLEQQLASLQTELSAATAREMDLDDRLQRGESDREQIQTSLSALKAERDIQVQDLQSRLETAESSSDTSTAQWTQVSADLEAASVEATNLRAELAHALRTASDQAVALEDLRNTHERVSLQLQQSQADQSALLANLDDKNDSDDGQQALALALSQLKTHSSTVEEQLAKTSSELSEVKTRLGQAELERTALQDNVTAAQVQMAEQLTMAAAKESTWQQDTEAHKTTTAELKANLASLQRQLEDTQAAHDGSQAKQAEAEGRVSSLQEELSSTTKRLAQEETASLQARQGLEKQLRDLETAKSQAETGTQAAQNKVRLCSFEEASLQSLVGLPRLGG